MSRSMLALALLSACKVTPDDLIEDPLPEPSLDWETPTAGTWIQGLETPITGSAVRLTDLSLGESPLPLDGDRFSTTTPLTRGINVLTVSGTDPDAHTRYDRRAVMAGTYNSPDGDVPEGLALRMNQGGLDVAAGLVTELVDPYALVDGFVQGTPIYEVDNFAITASVWVDYIQFDDPIVRLDPTPGILNARVTIPNFELAMYANVDILGLDPFDTDATAWANNVVIDVGLTVDAQDGDLVVDVATTDIELQGFGYTLIDGFASIEAFFADTVAGFIEDQVAAIVEEQVPALVGDTLSQLDIAFATEVLGKQISIAADFARAFIDNDGVGLIMDVATEVPEQLTLTYLGVVDAPNNDPHPRDDVDTSVAISDDLLNRVLFEAWYGGLLEIRLSTDDGTLEPFLLSQFQAEQGTISTAAQLPPVIIERDGAPILQIGELRVTIDTPGGELGEHLVIALSGEVPLEITFEDGEVKLKLGTPDLKMMVRESDWNADNETTTALIEEKLPIDTLLILFGSFGFPIPSIGGLQIEGAAVVRDESAVHTRVDAGLSLAPVE
jgi:hypothetical protein